jgi:membrane fusion protein (multidrug efflux system)
MRLSDRIDGEFQVYRKANRPSCLTLATAFTVLALGALGYNYLRGSQYESTDDATVHAASSIISSQTSGRVAQFEVRDNQHVTRGQVLFRLDDTPYRLAAAAAEAKLAGTRLHVETLKAVYQQETANLAAAEDVLTRRRREFDRQKLLLSKGVISQWEFDQAIEVFLDTTEKLLKERQIIAEELAELGGNADVPTDQHPSVLQARAQLDQALLNLTNATVRAPDEGITTNLNGLQIGDYVQTGTPLFDLISDHKVWVEARFSKSQLAHIGVGQHASINIEGHPRRDLIAHVTGLDVGVDSVFSPRGPRNATGDLASVAGRSRVRLDFDHSYPPTLIYAGLNVLVDIDAPQRPPLLRLIDAFL